MDNILAETSCRAVFTWPRLEDISSLRCAHLKAKTSVIPGLKPIPKNGKEKTFQWSVLKSNFLMRWFPTKQWNKKTKMCLV
jgi:hypothetical protein